MRVTPEILHTLQAHTERIRNICIIAHVDHGKTTLSDSLVSANGIISEKLAGKIRYLDNTEEEQMRGITMKSSAISLMFQNEPFNTGTTGDGEETQEQEEPYLINLVDSPGHVDFSFDVSTAVRLCDGALVLVDVVEGVCAQTHAVLRQAWQEGIRPCLVINKIDRLILELQFTPFEAYQRINRILEQANAIISSLIRAEVLQSLEGQDDVEEDRNWIHHEQVTEKEKELLFSPSTGNVMFASAYDGWAFAIGYFAQLYAKKLELPFRALRQALWGEFYYQPKTKKILTKSFASNAQPMFVTFILEPIWHAYTTLSQPLNTEEDLENARKLTRQLRVAKVVQERDLKHPERRNAIQAVMRKWLPLATNVLKMVTRALPNPLIAQQKRALTLCGTPQSLVSYELDAFHALENCQTSNSNPNAPVIVYVCKMISVEASLLSNFHQVAGQLGVTEGSQEVFVAVARVFSGVLHAGKPLYVFGPKFQGLTSSQAANIDQIDLSQVEHVTQVSPGLTKLYMLMGRELHALEKVPAGNIVGIIGLQDHVLKTATLSSTLKCPSLAKMPYQAKPIVRVAVEPEDPRHFEELEAGLQRLYRSDPTVEVQVQATGEHVIVALGELHLERCIKDLKERFAKVAVRVSPPLVGFRESILDGNISSLQESVVFKDILAALGEEASTDQAENEDTTGVKVARGRTPDTSVTIKVRALPLPLEVSKLLEEHVDILGQLTSQQNASTVEEEATEEVDVDESTGAAGVQLSSRVNTFKKQLKQALVSSEETFWRQLALEKIWCFGPRRVGPNVLINNVDGYAASNSVFTLDQVTEVAIQGQEERFEMLSKLENSLMTGFQLATAAGPLCDEPVWGVAFILEDFVYHPMDQSTAPVFLEDGTEANQAHNNNNYGPLSGQVISCMKNTCRLAFVKQPVRLVEAIYDCTVQCQSEQLGRLYSVINKRRGNVFQEELSDGTSLFTIKAHLPVVESFGFATELLINTSGAASNPQLTFSHWSVIEDDPFFQPQTEEEREDYGERVYEHNYVRKYIDAVRKRKGLARDEKIVVHAEKQRTLARKK